MAQEEKALQEFQDGAGLGVSESEYADEDIAKDERPDLIRDEALEILRDLLEIQGPERAS